MSITPNEPEEEGFFDKIKDSAGDMWENAKEKISEEIDELKEKASDLAGGKIQEITDDLKEKASDKFKDITGKFTG